MDKPKNASYILVLLVSVIIMLGSARSVSAIVPVIEDIVVWSSGSDTVLNVTVHHTPQTSFHHTWT